MAEIEPVVVKATGTMSTRNATIRRARKDIDSPYKAMSRALFEDNRLSFEAKGVMGYILVKPDDWVVRVTDLRKAGNIGRDKAYSIISELMEAGYIERKTERRKDGTIGDTTYLVYEEPLPCLPYPAEPYPAEPIPVNTEHTKEEELLSKKSTKEEEYPVHCVHPLLTLDMGGTSTEIEEVPLQKLKTQKKGIKERKKEKPSASSIDENSSLPSVDGSECLQQSLLNQETNTPSPKVPPAPPSQHKALEAAYVAKLAQYEPNVTLNWGQIGRGIKALVAAGWTVEMVEAGMDFLENETWVKGHVSPQLLGQHAAKVVAKRTPSRDEGGWGFNTGAQW